VHDKIVFVFACSFSSEENNVSGSVDKIRGEREAGAEGESGGAISDKIPLIIQSTPVI